MEKYSFDKRTQEILEHLTIPFAVYQYVDKRVVTIALSQGFCDEFGFKCLEDAYYAMDSDMYRATHPDDKDRVAEAAYRFAAFDEPYDVVYRTRTLKDSDYIILHAYGRSIHPEPGVRLCLTWYACEGHYNPEQGTYGSILNQTLNHILTEESRYHGMYYDSMTGLPDMTYFFELAEADKAATLKKGGQPALMYIDFRGMKFFNMRYGFAEGDKMLQQFADILKQTFSTENCCRIGADHFSVITEEDGLEEKLNNIFDEWHEFCDGVTLPVHVGIYRSGGDSVHISVALDRAKLACDGLRGNYSSAFSYYSKEVNDYATHKQYIIENIDRAIEEKWIKLYIQPIIRTINGHVCDVEALARWDDPEKGMISPAGFIPALEESGLIYKLDLYMLDQVIEAIKIQMDEGFYVVPHSINLSRSDFEACDIVEEFRRRVDEAGISRDKITVEVTESMIGSDFGFMREQVERFQKLGFPVWMDDFGSGYSSLDVLQSIRFDLLKFDMSFMKRLDEGEGGKAILTELMKMATALGVNTVCEGVETEEQIRFLQEIGCSKLQGFYFSKPESFEDILEMHRTDTLIKTENPDESDYYESISRLNLFDLEVIASGDENVFHNTFSTIPMAVLELKDDATRYIRSNRSYREFVKRFFDFDVFEEKVNIGDLQTGFDKKFLAAVRQCCSDGKRTFLNDKLPDGSLSHSIVQPVGVNPVTGSAAVAIAVLSISEPDDRTTYADIARSLAADYYNIFVIDLDTDDYIEYSSQVGGEELSIERHGEDFFESARRDTMTRIYEDDRETFLKLFTKENVLKELDNQGVFTTTYRLIDTGEPMFVNMKITRMEGGNRIILGISIVDAQMRQLEEEQRLRQEKISLGRIAALSPNYIVLYTVDPETGHYTQYSPSAEFERFGLAAQGEDFFRDVILDAPKAIDPEDIGRHLRIMTKNNMMREIKKNGVFIHNFRILMNGKSIPVRLRATIAPEDDKDKIIVGTFNDDIEEHRRRLEDAYEKERDNSTIFTHVALSLARGYTDLFYVNIDTDDFIEFHTDDEQGVLTAARRGTDFFEGCERDAKLFVHPDDQAAFIEAMDREYLEKALSENKVFELVYRRILDGRTFYVRMKVSRMEDDDRFVVIAVADIDEEMKQREAEKRREEERIVYARLHALTGNFICVYVVDPETDNYREFSATENYEETFAQEKEGVDFFGTVREAAKLFTYPDDLERFLSIFTKENVMTEIERSGIFTLGYRLMMDDKPVHLHMKAAMIEEKEGRRLIVGLNDVDVQVRQEEEYGKRLAEAQSQATVDALTHVKNKHAYLENEMRMDRQIKENSISPFAIVMLDVNDLKIVNDTEGHQAGDQYLQDACKIICDIFKHSPVFRIGGDEFAVIAQGNDYECIDERIGEVNKNNMEAADSGGIMIACGMARYEEDSCVADVFERADQNMYDNKMTLKSDDQTKGN